jgi:hypothetical protein
MDPSPATPTDDGGDELAQPLNQKAATKRARKIVKRKPTILDMFNHNGTDGQRELAGSPANP